MPSHGHHGDDDRSRSRRRFGGRSDDVPYDRGYDGRVSRPLSRRHSDDMLYYGGGHDDDPRGSLRRQSSCDGMPSHGHHGDHKGSRSRRRSEGRSDEVHYDRDYDVSRSRVRSRRHGNDMLYYDREHNHDPSRSRQRSERRDNPVAIPPRTGDTSSSVTSSHNRLAPVPKGTLIMGARASNDMTQQISRGHHVAPVRAIPKPSRIVQITKVPAIARTMTVAVPKPYGAPPTMSDTIRQRSWPRSESPSSACTVYSEVIESTVAADAAAAASTAAEAAATTARHAATAATAAADASEAAAAAAKAASARVFVLRAARQRSGRQRSRRR